MTHEETHCDILESSPTDSQVQAARRFLESCPYSTTAIWALARALEQLETEADGQPGRVSRVLWDACDRAAEAEAAELSDEPEPQEGEEP